jgi:hypothetical protein
MTGHAPASAIAANGNEALFENPGPSEADVRNQLADLVLGFVDQVGPRFGMLTTKERLVFRQHATAHAIACLNNRNLRAFLGEIVRGRQSRKPGSGHDDRDAA